MRPNLARHEESRAVINTDVVALNKYKQERALHRKIEQLSKDMVDVKRRLQNIDERLDRIEKQINVEA